MHARLCQSLKDSLPINPLFLIFIPYAFVRYSSGQLGFNKICFWTNKEALDSETGCFL